MSLNSSKREKGVGRTRKLQDEKTETPFAGKRDKKEECQFADSGIVRSAKRPAREEAQS